MGDIIIHFDNPWVQTMMIALAPLFLLVQWMFPQIRKLAHELYGGHRKRGLKDAVCPFLIFVACSFVIVSGAALAGNGRPIFHGLALDGELQLDYQWPRGDVCLKWDDIKSISIEKKQWKRKVYRLRIETEKDACFSVWTPHGTALLDAQKAIEKRSKTGLLK